MDSGSAALSDDLAPSPRAPADWLLLNQSPRRTGKRKIKSRHTSTKTFDESLDRLTAAAEIYQH